LAPTFDRAAEWFTVLLGTLLGALAYPFGYHDTITLPVVDSCGVDLVFTVDEFVNVLGVTDPRLLGRFSIFRADFSESFTQRLTGKPL